MIFDTHVHYNLAPLFSENDSWKKHWETAQQHKVIGSLIVGVDVTTSHAATAMAHQASNLYAAVGIHPSEYQELYAQKPTLSETEISQLITNQTQDLAKITTNQKVKAIGETGLDYFRLPEVGAETIKAWQQLAFKAHLKLAVKHRLPLIIHARDKGEAAYWDILSILKAQSELPPVTILHCVSGPEAYLSEALSLGAYLGVAGNVTYKNSEHIRNLVRHAPKDKLLLETDAPYLPPQEFRGKICEPWMISLTAEYLEDELGVDLNQILENTQRAFQIEL